MKHNYIEKNKEIWNKRYTLKSKTESKILHLYEKYKTKYFLTSAFVFNAVKKEVNKYMKDNHRILDAGCGDKSVMIENFDLSRFQYFAGLDLSFEGLKTLKEKFKSNHKQSAVIGNGLFVPFKPETFDLIISVSMIEYLHDEHVPQFFKEIERITSNGGIIIIAYPNYDSIIRRKCMEYSKKHYIRDCEGDNRMYASVDSFIEKTNLKVIKDYTVGLTSQLFYLNYFFHKGLLKKILRKFVTLITIFTCSFFFWINFLIKTKGDYHITILKKNTN